jgi:hypothetical protein
MEASSYIENRCKEKERGRDISAFALSLRKQFKPSTFHI